jgi:FixJ family two-component response regulator
MDSRGILRHLGRGQSDRAVAEALGIDRKTVARYRTWAAEQELLEEDLPSLSELQQLVEETLSSAPPPGQGAGPCAASQ